jgi:hypothetical protein
MAIYGSLGEINVASISSTITDTAVDVFVYDTRKDSDGGAWRKRTQHTSWYNETLNTATRGSRKDFPAVAVIVAQSDKVTIYDADDPDMPMWMIFVSSGYGMSGVSIFNAQTVVNSSIYALNGILVGGQYQSTDTYGSPVINFISEKVVRMDPHTTEGGLWLGNIADRNSSKGYASQASSGQGYLIIDSRINDVAMTVLPNAPIDPSTGLPVPTIAVATNGGVSVIKDDGMVASISGTLARSTSFIHKNNVIYNYASFGTRINPIPVSNTTDVTWGNNRRYGRNLTFDKLFLLNPNSNGSVSSSDTFYHASPLGLTILYENTTDSATDGSNGMVAYATTSYNTGWMHGNIKGAWLSDTSTASATGTELVTNGNFSNGTLSSYFNINNCSLSVVSNQLVVTSNTSNYYCEFYIIISDITKPHYFTFQFVGASNLSEFGIYAAPATGYVTDTIGGWSNPSYGASRSPRTYSILIPAGNTIVGFVFPSPAVYTWTFDNISLKPVQELDRSVNNRGLAVYGTITKSVVATGADLVAYSNFRENINYLQQPYNSALDFGTNNFHVSFWSYNPGSQNEVWIGRFPNVGTGWGLYFANNVYDSYTVELVNGAWNTWAVTQGSTSPLTWTKWNAIRMFGVGWLIYRNGVFMTRHITSANTNFTSSGFAPLTISSGSNVNNTAKISLLHISASVPSPEQILKIYNDEKALFQPNSQCTLYGSSDAVTALAYDEDYETLYVGTSSGRSDFRGLERINNTTTAVTTAISASNGLIAEQ